MHRVVARIKINGTNFGSQFTRKSLPSQQRQLPDAYASPWRLLTPTEPHLSPTQTSHTARAHQPSPAIETPLYSPDSWGGPLLAFLGFLLGGCKEILEIKLVWFVFSSHREGNALRSKTSATLLNTHEHSLTHTYTHSHTHATHKRTNKHPLNEKKCSIRRNSKKRDAIKKWTS